MNYVRYKLCCAAARGFLTSFSLSLSLDWCNNISKSFGVLFETAFVASPSRNKNAQTTQNYRNIFHNAPTRT